MVSVKQFKLFQFGINCLHPCEKPHYSTNRVVTIQTVNVLSWGISYYWKRCLTAFHLKINSFMSSENCKHYSSWFPGSDNFFLSFTGSCIYLQQVLGIIPNRECWILLLTAWSSFSKWILLQVIYLWHNSFWLLGYNTRSVNPCDVVEVVILILIYWDKGIP